MSTDVNPYNAGQPVRDEFMFFGRHDLFVWLKTRLGRRVRVFIIFAPHMVGKTSFLVQVSKRFSDTHLCLYTALKEIPPDSTNPRRDLAAALESDIRRALAGAGMEVPPPPPAGDPAGRIRRLLEEAASGDERDLLLLVDDLHVAGGFPDDAAEWLEQFLSYLVDEMPKLAVLFTADESFRERWEESPFREEADVGKMGPFSTEESQQLITIPSQGKLRFDVGVTKHIAELNSNHPYFLQLFCYALVNRKSPEGWINLQDVDEVMREILDLPIAPFQKAWEESTSVERGVLAVLATQRGIGGLATRQDIWRYIIRMDEHARQDVVENALERLARRGILIRMGALSYRFGVDLFRHWLDCRVNPSEAIRKVDWDRPGLVTVGDRGGKRGGKIEGERRKKSALALPIVGFLLGMALVVLLAAGLIAFNLLPGFLSAPTPTPTATPRAAVSTSETTPTPAPTPTTAPTPTAPIVVSRSLPAITYMARGGGVEWWQIFVMEADGSNPHRLTTSEADEISPVWSPDGSRIAFVSQRDGNREVYVMKSDGTEQVNVSRSKADDWTPAWSPDGSRVAFSSNRSGVWQIYAVPLDNPDDLAQLTGEIPGTETEGSMSPVWSPEGNLIVYSGRAGGLWQVHVMEADGSKPRRLTFSEGNDQAPVWSPDGSRIAFESSRVGSMEVYVMDSNGGNVRNLTNVSYASDHGPVWSPDGSRILFYSNREQNWELFVMDADGGNLVNLTNTPDVDEQTPSWRP